METSWSKYIFKFLHKKYPKCLQVQRINEISSGGPRIALLSNLLNQEIQLLNAVEKKHFAVRKQVAAQRSQRKLDEMGKPVRWVGYKSI